MRLNKFQETFKETMLQHASGLDDVDADLRNMFIGNEISVEDRLKVYHNNIIGSVSASLCATFPILDALVGEGFLKSMARAFVFEHPPKSGCLHLYGAGFDDFIRGYMPAESLPYLADVATLELAINTAYYAPNDSPMKADALAQFPEEQIGAVQLSLRTSAVLIDSHYPLLEIKSYCENDAQGDAPDVLKDAGVTLMVYRPSLDVKIVELDREEFRLIQALQNGVSLGEALEAILAAAPDFDFAAFLNKHITLETFSALSAKS